MFAWRDARLLASGGRKRPFRSRLSGTLWLNLLISFRSRWRWALLGANLLRSLRNRLLLLRLRESARLFASCGRDWPFWSHLATPLRLSLLTPFWC